MADNTPMPKLEDDEDMPELEDMPEPEDMPKLEDDEKVQVNGEIPFSVGWFDSWNGQCINS